MIPKTYMLTAPIDAQTAFGTGMHSTMLVARLRMCNPGLHAPLPENYPHGYPGKREGMTTLWLGEPFGNRDGRTAGKKILAFHLGEVPEWTQVDDEGNIIRRGWRAVIEKCVKAKVFTAKKAESVFGVPLRYDGSDGSCHICRREGKVKPAKGKSDVCAFHAVPLRHSAKALQVKEEKQWLQQVSPDRAEKHLNPPLRPMLLYGHGEVEVGPNSTSPTKPTSRSTERCSAESGSGGSGGRVKTPTPASAQEIGCPTTANTKYRRILSTASTPCPTTTSLTEGGAAKSSA